ncbi:hypothetical protein [Candidatus Thiodictyon syntrophicum]|jgi:hypothetical protein|uniref:Uncharacterized protein n=1 Tax=Candidatus Thiodictyon syntrophicum TaxID=1166950 RepID=A0A2K8UF61_9GAMM|nr:hypothetical protein [Candidatus Thiodictyon syntrophicum]AUB84200.1 hypothetical protein THSYN_26835 [Candidatus Thiodictyon syntrophicum]
MSEPDNKTTVPVRRQFTAPPEGEGEAAAELRKYAEWRANGGELTPEQQRRAADHLERTAVELGGPIPARFKHLQYVNKARGQR